MVDQPQPAWQHPKQGGSMRRDIMRSLGALLLAAALTFSGGWPAAGAQQSGPIQAPPSKQAPTQPPPKKEAPEEQYTLAVEVPLVTVDVVVTDNRGNYIPDLKKEHFRVLEDGQPQTITNFAPTDSPITAVLLIEFSKLWYSIFADYTTLMGQYFLQQLKADDWVALVSYDLKPRIEVDFTRDKQAVANHLRRMYFPSFSEANLFDATIDTLERLKDVKGKKAIVLLASGFDTFSKATLDDTLKKLRQTDVTIFSVGVGREYLDYLDRREIYVRDPWAGVTRSNYLQAENNLRSFAEITGGRSWFPRFEGEWPGIFSDVAAALRNQYSIGYTPTNRKADGKFRKIKVQLVGPDGGPLKIVDQNGKQVKYVVYARQGYIAPKGGISD